MSQEGAATRKSRRALPLVLVVVAAILALLSVFAIWAKRQLLETDTWVETSTELLADEEIQEALSAFLVNALYSNVDVQGELEAQLPPPVKPLAGPIAGGVRQLAGEVSLRALQSSQIQGLWESANRAAHAQFLAIVNDESDAVSTTGGAVTLDLTQILTQVIDRLGLPSSLAEKIPPDAAQIEVLKSDELETAQNAVSLLETLAWALFAIALVLWAFAIYLAGARRRETLRAVGIAFVLVGALVLVLHRAAGNAVVESLSDAAANDAAIDNVWTIGTSQLTEIANATVLYGIFFIIAAWLAGPTRLATAIREAVAPWYREARYAYGAAAVFLILLFWWDPTEGTHRLVPSIVLIVLVIIGTEALRRQVAREFPDRVTPGSARGIAATIAARMREGREQLRAPGAAPAAPATAGDERVEALERLAKLRESGVLTDDELAAEKQRILAGS
jgi:hypothetical protein